MSKITKSSNLYRAMMPIVGLVLLAAVSIPAQSIYDYPVVESRSVDLFLKKQWAELEKFGNQALEAGVDYYALRYRIGVAQYEQKKYWNSARNFEAALNYNAADPWSLEYLYYSYLFTGRDGAAQALAEKMPPDLSEKIGLKPVSPIDFVYAEAGLKNSSLPDSVYGLKYASLGIGQQLGYRLRLFHGFSGIGLSESGPDFRQIEYYLKGDWYLGKGFTLIPAVHLISFDGVSLGALVRRPTTGEINVTQKAWAAHIGIRKSLGRLVVLPSFTQVRLITDAGTSVTNQNWALGLGVEYHLPFLQDRVTIGGTGSWQETGTSENLIWKASLNIRLAPRLFLSAEYFEPNTTNFTESFASVFNNATSILTDRTTIMLTWLPANKVAVFLIFQNENKQETNFSFSYRTFLAGMKYQF